MTKAHHCPGCQQHVIRARTEARRWQLLDPKPVPDGPVAAYRDGTGTWRARTLKPGEEPCTHEQRFMPHPATCPKPPAHRQRKGEARATRDGGRPRRKPQPTQATLI